nr:cytochrome b/b6 domain-containing protein [Lysobacter pythonis]
MFKPFARLLHWLMAPLILAMLYIGVGMVASLPHRDTLLALHRPLGIAILLLALLRLAYRWRHPPPALPADLPRWQRFAAHASHWLLYALMLAMPLIGWATLSAGGYPVELFAGLVLPPLLPHDAALYAGLRALHGVLGYLFFAMLLLHAAAALSHAWMHGDGVFSSMTWRRHDARRAHERTGEVEPEPPPGIVPDETEPVRPV